MPASWKPLESVGCQGIEVTDTVQNHVLGKVVRAVHDTYGEGEFIYLKGIGSTVAGTSVTYNSTTYVTTLAPAGSNIPQPIAFAMSANVASQYGWYQISGQAIAAKQQATATFVVGSAVGITATGVLSNSATGAEVQGAVAMAVATVSAATVQVLINRPIMQGRVT